ncbi:MAG: sigma-70 family RNA polymerase sigma factor [Tepidisphaeraceae bacterium]
MTDSDLLRAYAENRSEDAFAALIDRYVRLVYSACVRQLSDRHLAEDATQGVFVLLSQKVRKIPSDRLGGWLLTTARYACANIRRSQMRRQQREQVVAMNQDRKSDSDSTELLAMLDEALCHLRKTDREALVLRYLKEQPLVEVGYVLGISEEAARKRVARGMDKLRRYFSRRGLMTDSAALSAVMAEQAQGSALTPAVHQLIKQGVLQACHAGTASGAVGAAIAKGVNMTILTTKLKIAAVLAAIAVALLGGGWLISQVMTGEPPSPPAVHAAPVAAASTPSPYPDVVLDLSTPEKSFDSMTRAIAAGDRAKLYACLTADANRPATLLDGLLEVSLSQNRLIRAVNQVFGNGERARHFGTPDTIMRIIISGWPRGSQIAKIQGDTASLPLSLPPMVIQLLPQSVRSEVQTWSGASVPFVRSGNQWKANIDQVGRIIGSLDGQDINTADHDKLVAILMGEAKSQARIADEIINRNCHRLREAEGQWQRDLGALFTAEGIRSFGFDFVPAAPASGVPDIQGAWEGSMDLFGTGIAEGASTKTRIVLKLVNTSGSYSATIDCIEMGRKDVPTQKVVYDYPIVRLEWNPRTVYTLTLNTGATEMYFDVTSFQGQSREVVLKRTDSPDPVPQRLAESDFTPRNNSDLQGYWEGTIGAGPDALPVNLKIAEPSEGTFHAELDSPMLGASGLPSSVFYNQPVVKLKVETGAGMFRGKINGAATEITGSWIQAGQAKSAEFHRADFRARHAYDADKVYSYTSSTDLQGHWKGSWDFIGTKIRLALDIAKLPDGTFSAALANLDQFGNDDPIPPSDFQYSPSGVRMEWKWAGGAFEGKLKNGKLTGVWRQGGGSFPLVFTRTAP